MEFNKVLETRRTVRKFTDYYVTDNEVKTLVKAASIAPSWANTQVWEFIAVRDKEIIRELTETYSEYNPARACSFGSSVILVCCIKTKISGYKNEVPRTVLGEWGMFDMGLPFDGQKLILEKGERLFIFSDGIPEAMDTEDEEYSDEKLEDFFKKETPENSRDFISKILWDVRNYTKGASQSDDITAIYLIRK